MRELAAAHDRMISDSDVVTVRGLGKADGDRVVVDGLDLDVGQGEVVGLLGREDGCSASGPACRALTWRVRRVGGLGPGLTSDSACAARAV